MNRPRDVHRRNRQPALTRKIWPLSPPGPAKAAASSRRRRRTSVDAQGRRAAALPDRELTWTFPCQYVDHDLITVLNFVDHVSSMLYATCICLVSGDVVSCW
uniref:Uncharacterized protein n=1 Tax=Arundo donax TaxID=35708 RepID=A0A0A9BY34_ARUDO